MPKRNSAQVDLEAYLRRRNSPLADHVQEIINAGNRYRIDPRLIVAISGGETSFGTNGNGPKVYNAWGMGPGYKYGSWKEGIDAAAKLLRTGYVGQGLTSLAKIQQKWAPIGAGNDPSNLNSNWIRTNGQFYSDLGGNPNDVTKGWRNAASPQVVSKAPPSAAPGTVPSPPAVPAGFQGWTNLIHGQAIKNLQAISRGEDPTKMLDDLLAATIEQTQVNALALKQMQQVPPGEQQVSPDGGSYNVTPTTETAANSAKQRAVQIAKRQIGKPYVWGAVGPKSFDCSGLIEWAYEQAGIKTPGRITTYTAAKLGKSVRGGPMEPGDWIITNHGKHMVMYIGGGEVIAAPHSGTNVQIQKLADHKAGIVDVRRFP